MFLPINALGVIFALTSAVVWGGGDFSGGLATRRANQFHVLAVSALSGMVVLFVAAALRREAFPSSADVIWALSAGLAGAVGLAALYRALSLGQAAIVAPTSGVLGAALPVAFGVLTNGAPAPTRVAGFVLALLGIWLVSGSASNKQAFSESSFLLACLAGLGFGGFFILIALVAPGAIFTPLILARAVELGVALVMIRATRLSFPSFTTNPIALLAGVLDVGGNIFYVLARQFVRLDVAAVLASFYPASTVILAGLLLKEKMSGRQGVGVAICLLAIILITL
jgi:drug/metabolite transporter (DMT)-like permease